MRLVESVPNFSEGRRLDVVERLANAVESVRGAFLLDRTMDASHNRSVLTIAGQAEPVTEALERAVAGDRVDRAELGQLTRFFSSRSEFFRDCSRMSFFIGPGTKNRFFSLPPSSDAHTTSVESSSGLP